MIAESRGFLVSDPFAKLVLVEKLKKVIICEDDQS